MSRTVDALLHQASARATARLLRRDDLAAEHIRLLAERGHTPDTCPVCDDCPDWVNNPPPRGTY